MIELIFDDLATARRMKPSENIAVLYDTGEHYVDIHRNDIWVWDDESQTPILKEKYNG